MKETKYFLHGGSTGKNSERNRSFFREIINSVEKVPINILLIYFAREESSWQMLLEEDKKKFSATSPQRNMHKIEVASMDKDTFLDQIKSANIIFIRGGNTEDLIKRMNEIVDLDDLFSGKVIAGSSAGAYIFSRYYYSNSNNEIREGLGILPIKLFAHYTDEQINNYKKLEAFEPGIPTLKIKEADFLVRIK